MKDLYILGAGGHAKEVYFLADRIGKWNIKGMLDLKETGKYLDGKM